MKHRRRSAPCPTCGAELPAVSEACWLGSCWGCHDEGLCGDPRS